MKRLAAMGLIAMILTLFTPSPANADEGCVISVAGIRVCGTLLNQPLPSVVTVTIRPNPIRIPGPTSTVTLPPVRLPGPTKTVTIPGPVSTVTVQPGNTRPSEAPSAAPTPTATVTKTVGPTPAVGQTPTSRATVAPSPEVKTRTRVETRTKTETIVRTILVGTLVTLLIAGLGILALFLGYILGHRDAQRDENRFLKSLVGVVRGEKH